MMRLVSLFAFVVAAAIVFSLANSVNSAYACSCLWAETPQEEVQQSDAVFAGQAIEITNKNESEENKLVKFKVERAWKGISEPEVAVTDYNIGECTGPVFLVGKSYVVYASEHAQDKTLTAGYCGRTAEIQNVSSVIAVLGEGYVPPIAHGEPVFVEQTGPLPFILGLGAAVATIIAVLTLRHSN